MAFERDFCTHVPVDQTFDFSKILYLKVRCPIYGMYFLLEGEEEEEARIKDPVISVLAFHANVRFMLLVTGSSGRKEDREPAGSWSLGVFFHFLAGEAAWGGGKSRTVYGRLDLSLNRVAAT